MELFSMERTATGGEIICESCWKCVLFGFSLKVTGEWAILLVKGRENICLLQFYYKVCSQLSFCWNTMEDCPPTSHLGVQWACQETPGNVSQAVFGLFLEKELNNISWEASGLLFSNAVLPWTTDRTYLFDPYIHMKTWREQNQYRLSLLLKQSQLHVLISDNSPPADPSAGRYFQ